MASDAQRSDERAVPDPRVVRRHFARAAASYDAAAILQKEIGGRMVERLDVVKLAPIAVLDAGCGTGDALADFAIRYPGARRIAIDIALPMLEIARTKTSVRRSALARLLGAFGSVRAPGPPELVCGDIAALPFGPGRFDLVWSNLVLQWVGDLPKALAELHRVLAVGGLLTFTTFGPDTLKELRRAFSGIDGHAHVGSFIDMHDIGDMLVAAGFADPVMHMEVLTLTFADTRALMRDLKAIGATNAMNARPRALMGRHRFERALEALEATRRDGRIPATFEVIYGHAWKAAPLRTAQGDAIVRFDPKPRR